MTDGWFAGLEPDDLDGAAAAIRDGSADRTETWPAVAVEDGFADDAEEYYERLHDATMAATERAVDEGVLPDPAAERIGAVVDDLPGLLDHEPEPALIHGDVWRENLRLDGDGIRAFLDPACYYADPEIELAYVEWTNTGGDAFFERYREVTGLADGYQERAAVYRLYPLLTHVRHFGGEYLEPLRETLSGLGY